MRIVDNVKAALRATFLGSSASAGPALAPASATLARPEGPRHYLIATPPAASGKLPLVVILHGGGASAKQVLGLAFPPSPLSVFLEIGARDGCVVIAPDAGKGGWNDGMVAWGRKTDGARRARDDVGFIEALINHGIAAHSVDPERVYLIGVSHGGFMAYRMAAERPHWLAAFSTVLAGMPTVGPSAQPARALPFLAFGGTGDRLVRYGGGKHWYAPGFMRSMRGIEDTVRVWCELAGLGVATRVETLPRRDARTGVTRFLWGGAADGMQVGLVRIERGGHAEPSSLKRYPECINRLVGAQNHDIEVAEAAWEFFRHKRSRGSVHDVPGQGRNNGAAPPSASDSTSSQVATLVRET